MRPVRRYRRALAAVMIVLIAYSTAFELLMPRDDAIGPTKIRAVVVLGSGLKETGDLEVNGAQRLLAAIGIAKAQRVPLVTTRGRRDKPPYILTDRGQRRVIDSARLLQAWVTLDGIAINTRDEAERMRDRFEPMPIALVTSRLHTRRACGTFEALGFHVTCVSSGREEPWWKTPYFIAYESAAWIKYRMKGWI